MKTDHKAGISDLKSKDSTPVEIPGSKTGITAAPYA